MVKSAIHKELEYRESIIEKDILTIIDKAMEKLNFCKNLVLQHQIPLMRSDIGIDEMIKIYGLMLSIGAIRTIVHETNHQNLVKSVHKKLNKGK